MSSERIRPGIRPCTRIYLLLMALTVVTWAIGRMELGGLELSMLVLGFGLLKGHLVGDYFMGLKGVNSIWRWIVSVWLIIPGALIGTAFWLAANP